MVKEEPECLWHNPWFFGVFWVWVLVGFFEGRVLVGFVYFSKK